MSTFCPIKGPQKAVPGRPPNAGRTIRSKILFLLWQPPTVPRRPPRPAGRTSPCVLLGALPADAALALEVPMDGTRSAGQHVRAILEAAQALLRPPFPQPGKPHLRKPAWAVSSTF